VRRDEPKSLQQNENQKARLRKVGQNAVHLRHRVNPVRNVVVSRIELKNDKRTRKWKEKEKEKK
jgi:hypothetical protein